MPGFLFNLTAGQQRHCTVSFLPQESPSEEILEGAKLLRGCQAIIYKPALASKPAWGNWGTSLVLTAMAAKETFPQFANRLCTQHRQGSAGDPGGNGRHPGALQEHYCFRLYRLDLGFCPFLKKGVPLSPLPCCTHCHNVQIAGGRDPSHQAWSSSPCSWPPIPSNFKDLV